MLTNTLGRECIELGSVLRLPVFDASLAMGRLDAIFEGFTFTLSLCVVLLNAGQQCAAGAVLQTRFVV